MKTTEIVKAKLKLASSAIKQLPKSASALLLGLLYSGGALAYKAPSAGDTGYELYELVVENGLKGAFGFVLGICLVGIGFSKLNTNMIPSLIAIVAGGMLIKLDKVMTSFGALAPHWFG
ncbi:hypothetical protein [Vibrio harveyi]|uniref:hypothetical protein n=1 Tax=Vibrio harveyi TaxID=669 RepID=UPI003BB79728